MMGFGIIWMLFFWGVIILLAIWLIVTLFPNTPKPSSDSRLSYGAQDILDQRYARGELSTEEYEEMRRTIQSS